MKHCLRIEKPYFESVLCGEKTFEIRLNDRGFQKGDEVVLMEVDQFGVFSGREETRRIGYVTNVDQKENYVVFSLLPTEPEERK